MYRHALLLLSGVISLVARDLGALGRRGTISPFEVSWHRHRIHVPAARRRRPQHTECKGPRRTAQLSMTPRRPPLSGQVRVAVVSQSSRLPSTPQSVLAARAGADLPNALALPRARSDQQRCIQRPNRRTSVSRDTVCGLPAHRGRSLKPSSAAPAFAARSR